MLSATSGYPLSSWKDSNRWTDCMSSIQESTLKIKSSSVLQMTCLGGPLVSLSKAYNYFFLIRLVNLKDHNQYVLTMIYWVGKLTCFIITDYKVLEKSSFRTWPVYLTDKP